MQRIKIKDIIKILFVSIKNIRKMKNPKTTISGILIIILSVLSTFGVIDGEQVEETKTYIPEAVGGIVGIISVFFVGDKKGGI